MELVGNEALEIEVLRERPFGSLRLAHLFELQLEPISQTSQFRFDTAQCRVRYSSKKVIELIPGRREQAKYRI